jgi:Ca2+-binding EF-hand superfamily protein
MEYNFLLLEDNRLSIKKNKTFFQLTQENIDKLKEAYSLISINEIKGNNPLSPKVIELLKDNEVVINFEKVSSALKELESNKIIAHLSRENFRKISFPIFVQSEYLKTYLKDSGLQFELSLFLENSNFLKIELDS